MLRGFLVLVFMTGLAAPAGAMPVPLPGIPNAWASTVPDCIQICAGGDLSSSVIVRDNTLQPVPNSLVIIDFIACPGFVVCDQCADTWIYDEVTRTVRKPTDAQGAVTFSICGGGTCGGQVSVYADGIALGQRPLAVTDRNADLAVDPEDLAGVQALVGTADRSADFDCSGGVDAADVAFETAHLGHMCLGPTPARPSSWGTLKTMYR